MGRPDPLISSASPLTAEQLKLRSRMAGRLDFSSHREKPAPHLRRLPERDQQQPQGQAQQEARP